MIILVRSFFASIIICTKARNLPIIFQKNMLFFHYRIARLVRYKHRTSFVSEQGASVVNFSKIWLYQAFEEFK
jgi:ABC-type molybdate transport system ATPase subunit